MIQDLLVYALEKAGAMTPLIVLLAAWLVWKIWLFVVRPRLYRREVLPLPYNIPFIGHAISMFKDTTELCKRADDYFNHSGEPYALQVAGQQLIVVSHHKDKAEIFKNTEAFSFDPFINIVYRRVGNVSESGLKILWRKVSEGFVSLHPNPKQHVLVKTGQDLLHKQLLRSDLFKELVSTVTFNMEARLRWDDFPRAALIHQSRSQPTKTVSLHRWVRDVTIGAQTYGFFGPRLEEILPSYTSVYDQWDINSWMATYQYPAFMAQAAVVPREQLVDAIMQFLETPKEKRTGGVPYVSEVEDEMRHAGLDTETSARVLMIILWGINSNVHMTTFWMMVHILQDNALMALIRAEIGPVMAATRETTVDAPEVLRAGLFQECPILNSVFNEILRFYNTGSSSRQTTREVHISGKTIAPGTMILLPQRHLLLDKAAFGPDADVVNCYRFYNNKELERHEFYRPFGQGITRCRGATIGRFESLSFVAWALWRYDLKMISEGQRAPGGTIGTAVPRVDLKKPSLGISKQVEGDDMMVEVSSSRDLGIPMWAGC